MMTYCDLMLIARGYRRRNVLEHQFLRLVAFYTRAAVVKPDNKEPDELWPLYFDRYKMPEKEAQLSQEDVKGMLNDMDLYRQFLKETHQS